MQYSNNRKHRDIKWKTILALILIIAGVILNWSWIWGALFLFWAGTDLIYQETHLVEVIKRAENPILYWLVVVTWILLAIISFFPGIWT